MGTTVIAVDIDITGYSACGVDKARRVAARGMTMKQAQLDAKYPNAAKLRQARGR
jgi:hypothetical protein